MDPLQALLIGVVAPGALALVLVALARGAWRQVAGAAPWASGLALAAGYALGFGLVLGWPSFPPVDVTQVSPWVALALAPLGAIASARARGVATALIGAATGVFLAYPLNGGDAGALLGFAALIALTFVALERGLDQAMAKADPRGAALATTVLVSGAAAAILFSDTASLAQVTGGLAAATGAFFALGLVRPGAIDLRRGAPVIAGVLATNLWSAGLYANGRYEVIALIALGPLAVALLSRFATRPAKTLVAVLRPAMLLALPVALAAVLAGTRYFATDAGPSDAAGSRDGPRPASAADSYDPDYGY